MCGTPQLAPDLTKGLQVSGAELPQEGFGVPLLLVSSTVQHSGREGQVVRALRGNNNIDDSTVRADNGEGICSSSLLPANMGHCLATNTSIFEKNVRFYLVANLFLLFDIETIFLFPSTYLESNLADSLFQECKLKHA